MTQLRNLFKNKRITIFVIYILKFFYCSGLELYKTHSTDIDSNDDCLQEILINNVSTLDYPFMNEIYEHIVYTINSLPISNYSKDQLYEGSFNLSIVYPYYSQNTNTPTDFFPYGSYRLNIWFQPKEYIINQFYFKEKELNFASSSFLTPFYSAINSKSLVRSESFFDDSGYCGWSVDVRFGKVIKIYYCAYLPSQETFFYFDIINRQPISEIEFNLHIEENITVKAE